MEAHISRRGAPLPGRTLRYPAHDARYPAPHLWATDAGGWDSELNAPVVGLAVCARA